MIIKFLFFFFSSRRRHTRCSRDWSSDVCSSDLTIVVAADAMNRDLGTFSPAQPAELVPGPAGEHMQQEKLIVLEIGALPDLEQMCGDGKVTFAGCLTQLQHHH